MRHRLASALDDQTIRFVITGCGSAALFYTLSLGFMRCGAPAFGGTLAAYGIALVASYTTQHRWTFGGTQRHTDSLPRYLASQACSGVLSSLVAHVVASTGQPASIVSLASTLTSGVTSYVLSRYWAFAPR